MTSSGGSGGGSTFTVRLPGLTTAADRNEIVPGIQQGDDSISPSSFRVSFDLPTNPNLAANNNTDHTLSIALTEQQQPFIASTTVGAVDENKVGGARDQYSHVNKNSTKPIPFPIMVRSSMSWWWMTQP